MLAKLLVGNEELRHRPLTRTVRKTLYPSTLGNTITCNTNNNEANNNDTGIKNRSTCGLPLWELGIGHSASHIPKRWWRGVVAIWPGEQCDWHYWIALCRILALSSVCAFGPTGLGFRPLHQHHSSN